MEKTFQVGFARRDITPQKYMTLAGFGTDAKRMCNNIIDRIAGTCLVLQDAEGQRLVWCCLDICHIMEHTTLVTIRDYISEAIGIDKNRIMVSASHTHGAPSFYEWDDKPTHDFMHHMGRQMAKAVKEAVEDLAPAQAFVGKRELKSLNFKRHYYQENGFSSTFGNGSPVPSPIVAHVPGGDHQVQLIRFVRQDALDIVLVNWPCHPTITGADLKPDMSFDYPGIMRNHVEGLVGCHCVFMQGAGGDMVPSSRVKDMNVYDGNNHVTYGRVLAEKVVELLNEDMHPVKTGPIKSVQNIFSAAVDHSDDHLAEKAKEFQDGFWDLTPEEQRARQKAYGFRRWLHAGCIITRAARGDSKSMELDAVSMGDLAFATAPFEMFSSGGLYIKEHSPYPMTFVCGYTNGHSSYIADDAAFTYDDCYEVDSRTFGRGTAEDIAAKLVDMLKEMKD